jgi:stress response protein YsnF
VVPVYEEQLVLQKRLVLKEEVRITRTRQEQTHKQQVQLRQEHVRVEKLEQDGSTDSSDS